jgi:hypothetical protein
MEPKSAAEELPELYRAVLDRVGQLEAGGQRDLANRIREDAIRIYSRSWDERARRSLDALLRRHSVVVAGQRSLGRGLRRRAVRRRTVRAA